MTIDEAWAQYEAECDNFDGFEPGEIDEAKQAFRWAWHRAHGAIAETLKAATGFNFGDAGDCYERTAHGGRVRWEVRKRGVGVWWVNTQAEALAEFGIGGTPRGPR